MQLSKLQFKQFSKLSTIFKGDGTRFHLDGQVNFKLLGGGEIKLFSTDGICAFSTTITDHELCRQLLNVTDMKTNNDSTTIKFAKFNCPISQDKELMTLIKDRDYFISNRDYVKYELIIPVKDNQSIDSISIGLKPMKTITKLADTFNLKQLTYNFYGELSPIKITSPQLDNGFMLIMPVKI